MGLLKILEGLEISTGDFADFSDLADVYNAIMAFVCVLCAGLAAGLTMGLLSLDTTKLEIKTMTGTSKEKRAAASILPIVKQHHLLLVTLLLFNSIANETLPIFLGALVPNYLAVLISVTLILIFGEILPSALFTGPNQLLTAARLTGLVYFLLALFYPITFPISKVLDYVFGAEEDGGSISREELEALVILQGSNHRKLARENSIMSDSDKSAVMEEGDSPEDGLSSHEVNLMTGILKLSTCTVRSAMIPVKKVFMISGCTRLNEKSLYDILDCGFSRILVFKKHDRAHLMGYLLVKSLIVVNPLDEVTVESLPLREPLFVKSCLTMMQLLSLFQHSHCHLAVVSEDPEASLACCRKGLRPSGKAAMLGIVTLEDVLEKIIQSDIIDETDAVVYPSVYPNGGAPTVFYHHVIRPSVYGKSKAQGAAAVPKALLDQTERADSFAKRQNYRNLLMAEDSVVRSEQYSAMRRGYATFAPRDHATQANKKLEGTVLTSDSSTTQDDEVQPTEQTPLCNSR